MVLLAHFTPAELPGTLAVLLLGLSMGALIITRHTATRPMLVVVASLAVFGFLGYSGDVRGWSEGIRMTIDLIFLLHAVVLFCLVLRQHRTAAS
ncbi:MAG: hypothetical protein KJ006_13090 [Thermoleophilia bacterium]|nr:hypothetical protein [Thermoleophilia bacterium]